MSVQTAIGRNAFDGQIGIHATALGLAETGIGSALHAMHIPFSGTLLSLNQIFLLTRCLYLAPNEQRVFSPLVISANAALFKCLSPVGKKLTPMLAICMQGLFYNIGILCFGNTVLGRMTGGVLSSLWGLCQPLLLYWLFFGQSLLLAFEKFSWLERAFLGLAIAKILSAILIVLFTPTLPTFRFEQYLQKLSRIGMAQSNDSCQKPPVRQALSDLCKPLFLFSLVITAFFFYFSQGVSPALIWGVLRPLAVGFFCFFLMRLLPLKQWMKNGT